MSNHLAVADSKEEAIREAREKMLQRRERAVNEQLRSRLRLKKKCAEDVETRVMEREACANDPVRFINNWVWAYNPWNADTPLPTKMPFVLRPKQKEFVRWLEALLDEKNNGLIEKSRREGASYICLAFGLHHWLFQEGFSMTVGSRKFEGQVEQKGNLDALIPKVRYMLYNLPQWMMPKGYKKSEHDNEARLLNPAKNTAITGEAGENMGRGGRAQPLSSKVLTPTGWTTIGEIDVGDEVIGQDGIPHPVTDVTDQGKRDVYRVCFSDGTSALCCGDHLWRVTDRACRKVINRDGNRTFGTRYHVLTTKEIADTLEVPRQDDQTEYQYRIPIAKPVRYAPVDLPIHPYVIGFLLGDGALSQIDNIPVGVTSDDKEVINRLRELLPSGIKVKCSSGISYRIVDDDGRRGPGVRNRIKGPLFDLGLDGTTSKTKFIPEIYKRGTPKERLELLRGLLDADGWVGVRNKEGRRKDSGSKINYTSISEQLADDVAEVVQSLGGVAYKRKREGGSREFPHGDIREYSQSYQLTINLPTSVCPFWLPRKRDNFQETEHEPYRSIVDVQKEGTAEMRCITVFSEKALYITDNFAVTHNSSFYLIDEWAFVQRQDMVNAAVGENAKVHVKLSTPSGSQDKMHEEKHSGRYEVFTLHWQDNPVKNYTAGVRTESGVKTIYPWYELEKKEKDPVTVAQEIDIDYGAAAENVVVPSKWVRAAVENTLPEGSVTTAGLDVADKGHDTILTIRRGPTVVRIEDVGGSGQISRVERMCRTYEVGTLYYDRMGVGAQVTATLKKREDELPFAVEGITNSDRPTTREFRDRPEVRADERFKDYAAELWWALRLRFQATYEASQGKSISESDQISIPDRSSLITQLSQPTYAKTGAGKIKVDKKGQGNSSPDEAESCMYAFAEPATADWSSLTSTKAMVN